MKEELRKLLIEMEDWEKRQTNVSGVQIIKIPENKYLPARLAIDISPLNDKGQPIKKKGIVISNTDLFIKYSKIFKNQKVGELIETIDEIKDEENKTRKEGEIETQTFEL
ncbi:MAG: hypothetical protein ACTSWY_14395 [Promethearchaeota archaeon]